MRREAVMNVMVAAQLSSRSSPARVLTYQTATKQLGILRDRYYECSYLKRFATQRISPIAYILPGLLPAI